MITAIQLKKISPNTPMDVCEKFTPFINEYCPKYKIDTPIELASFLSQILHESGGLKWMREIWGPTKAQSGYEGRKDLGNTVAGDGKKFMGRGAIQTTGRANYTRMSKDMFGDSRLLDTPEILAQPQYAIWSACIYWGWRNLDATDDDNSIDRETKLVNGGYNGLDDRKAYFERAKKELGV